MKTNSPRKKNAARTIKRIVTKKYTVGKYRNFKGMHYTSIKSGNYPTHASSLMRRMKTFPVNLQMPIYRGVQNFGAKIHGRPKILNKLLANGKLENSFASFSTNKKYGAPSDGSSAILPNTMYWVNDANKGEIKYHNGPKIVCLYTETMSRRINNINKSRY